MKYFGTDGIRQAAEKFTPEFVARIVAGLADYTGTEKKVLIGGDTRESSEWILQDLSAALEGLGFEYASVGVLPTPAINYCFYEMGFDFAIDVTASHNPYTDNGIKIFERGEGHGVKLGAEGRAAIEAAIERGTEVRLVATTDREDLHEEAVNIYREHLLEYVKAADFDGTRIGMDCADGATAVINEAVFAELGADVKVIHADAAYGQKINAGCGSTHVEELMELVRREGLDFGVAFDGDGDRCLMIDAAGKVVDGDEIIAIIAGYLNLDKIAITVMANQGLLNWAAANGVTAEVTAVGDANVAMAMQEKGIEIGGEQSGHIILPGEATGDGMLTALMVTKICAETGKSLDELASMMRKLPQVIVNLSASAEQKSNLAASDAVKEIIARFDEKVKRMAGRLLVRASGTEPLIRITVWGDDEKKTRQLAEELKAELAAAL